MAKSFFNLQNFQAQIRETAPSRSDRFEVLIQPPPIVKLAYPDLNDQLITLMCEEASLPGYSATNVPVKIGAWTEFRNQNLEFLSQDIVFTFLSDINLDIRTLFESWIEQSVSPTSKEVSYFKDVSCDILIRVLDKQDNVRAQYIVLDAIPKLVNINQLSWSNNTHMRLSVSFAGRKWARIDVAPENTDDLKEELQRSGILRRVFNRLFR